MLATASATLIAAGSAPADTVIVPLSPVADTRLIQDGWGINSNFGSDAEIGVYQNRDRSLLRFDLANGLPDGSTLEAANLVLTISNPYGGNPNAEVMNVYRLTQAWTEFGVTWNSYDGTNPWTSAGGDYDVTPRSSSTASGGVGQAISWDVTSLAQEWKDNTYANYGLLVTNSGTTNGIHFASKESGAIAFRPYLAATITTPVAAPSGAWTWNGGDGVTAPIDGAGTWTDSNKWWNGVSAATWADGNNAIFGAADGIAGTVTIASSVAPASLWFQAAGSGTYTINGGTLDLDGGYRVIQTDVAAAIGSTISNGGIIKQGSSTLTLSGANTYSGSTVISAGAVSLSTATALPTTGAVTLAAGTTLSNDAPADTSFNIGRLTLSGGELAATAAPNVALGNFHLKGDVTVTGTTTSTISADVRLIQNDNRVFDVAATGDLSGVDLLISGRIGHYSGYSWGFGTKSGAGTMKLTGPVEIGGMTVNSGKIIFEDTAAGWGVFATNLTNNALVEISVNSGSQSFAVPITGSGSLTKTGPGSLTLSAVSNYSGGTFVDSGTLVLPGNGGLGRIQGTLTVNTNGTVETTGDGTGLGFLNQISSVNLQGGTLTSAGTMHIWNITGELNMTGALLQNNNGSSDANGPTMEWNRTSVTTSASGVSSTIAGRINLRPDSGYTGPTFTVADGAADDDLLVNAAVTESAGGMGITKAGLGTMTLTGVNSYTGPTTVSAGTLQIGNGVSGGSLASAAITNNAALVVNPATNVTFSQPISGMGSLTKQGTTTVSLTGANTYTGDTIVNAGTLELLNNSATVVSATVVNAGFETPDYTGGAWNYLSNDGIIAWSMPSSAAGISSSPSTWTATAPEGDQVGFIQLNGSITQTITIPSNGDYVVSFQSANRPGYQPSEITVSIDATTVGHWTASQLSSGAAFISRTTNPITLTAGTYTLTFQGTAVGADSATVIDAVSVSNPVTNGSLVFHPGDNGVSNKITGSGAGGVLLNGQFYLNLADAATAHGNSWMLVDNANLTEVYGANFSVTSNFGAFTNNSGVWSLTYGESAWTFDQSTGLLTFSNLVTDPFQNWIQTGWPTLGDMTPGGDPDNDGISNLMEYVLQGGDPSLPSGGILPEADASNPSNVVFTFYRRNASAVDTTQVFQHNTDLGSVWTDLAVPGGTGVVITPNTPAAGIDEVVITVPKNGEPSIFGRLRVTKP